MNDHGKRMLVMATADENERLRAEVLQLRKTIAKAENAIVNLDLEVIRLNGIYNRSPVTTCRCQDCGQDIFRMLCDAETLCTDCAGKRLEAYGALGRGEGEANG